MSRNAKVVLLIVLAIVFVAEAAVAAVIVLHRSKNHAGGPAGSNAQTNSTADKDACAIFTLADARQLLSGNVVGSTMTVTGSSPDVKVSGCSYKLGGDTNTPGVSPKTASLIVHRPLTAQGIISNQHLFGDEQSPDTQSVSDYGDEAYWDVQHGQLDVLKHNIWYVLTYGPTTLAERSLEQTRQLADILSNKL